MQFIENEYDHHSSDVCRDKETGTRYVHHRMECCAEFTVTTPKEERVMVLLESNTDHTYKNGDKSMPLNTFVFDMDHQEYSTIPRRGD